MSKWIKVESAKDLPLGNWLVKTDEKRGKEVNIQVAEIRPNMRLVGQYFHFDMPNVNEYYSTPVNEI